MNYKLVKIVGVIFVISILLSGFSPDYTSKNPNSIEVIGLSTVPTLSQVKSFTYSPKLGKSFTGFKEALAFKESQGKYTKVNSLGYLGKYQFGRSTLKRLKIYNATKFLKNPVLQEKAFVALCKINKWILFRDIIKFRGTSINGVKITESGILAAAHLAGAGSVKKYLRSNGSFKFKDAFGTSIQYYMKIFSGYNTSNIEADRKPEI